MHKIPGEPAAQPHFYAPNEVRELLPWIDDSSASQTLNPEVFLVHRLTLEAGTLEFYDKRYVDTVREITEPHRSSPAEAQKALGAFALTPETVAYVAKTPRRIENFILGHDLPRKHGPVSKDRLATLADRAATTLRIAKHEIDTDAASREIANLRPKDLLGKLAMSHISNPPADTPLLSMKQVNALLPSLTASQIRTIADNKALLTARIRTTSGSLGNRRFLEADVREFAKSSSDPDPSVGKLARAHFIRSLYNKSNVQGRITTKNTVRLLGLNQNSLRGYSFMEKYGSHQHIDVDWLMKHILWSDDQHLSD